MQSVYNTPIINSPIIYKCEYCSKILSTKSNLTNHQKTTKYCLLLQNKQTAKPAKMYKCSACDYISAKKDDTSKHMSRCKEKIAKDLIELGRTEEKIRNLKEQLSEHKIERKEKDEFIYK